MLNNIRQDYCRINYYSSMQPKNIGLCRILFEAMRNSGFRAVLFYRIGHWCRLHKMGFAAAISERLMRHLCHCWISTFSDIGPGFSIAHVCGIIVLVRAGKNCTLRQNVTIGGNYGKRGPDGFPNATLGDDVSISPGAVLLGPITVGSNTIIGANAVVTKSVPANSVVGAFRSEVLAQRSPEGEIIHSDSDKNIFLSRRELFERIEALEKRIRDLEDELKKSSHN